MSVAKQVNVHRAKTELSRLLAEVEKGAEIVIARGGTPVATLVSADPQVLAYDVKAIDAQK